MLFEGAAVELGLNGGYIGLLPVTTQLCFLLYISVSVICQRKYNVPVLELSFSAFDPSLSV